MCLLEISVRCITKPIQSTHRGFDKESNMCSLQSLQSVLFICSVALKDGRHTCTWRHDRVLRAIEGSNIPSEGKKKEEEKHKNPNFVDFDKGWRRLIDFYTQIFFICISFPLTLVFHSR